MKRRKTYNYRFVLTLTDEQKKDILKYSPKVNRTNAYMKLVMFKFTRNHTIRMISYTDYCAITTAINKKIKDKLIHGFRVNLPYDLGSLYVKRYSVKYVFDENGELDTLRSKAVTNWYETSKLWKEKPELRNKKYILYDYSDTYGYGFKIVWDSPKKNNLRFRLFTFLSYRNVRKELFNYIRKTKFIDYADYSISR